MKRSYSNVEVIDLTFSSENESDDDNVRTSTNEIISRTEDVSTEVEDPVLHVSSPRLKIPKLKKVSTDIIMDSSCVIAPSVHSVRDLDVNEDDSTGCSPVFNRLPNRFYCYCNKTQTKHTHEKYLAMRGLTKDRRVYWNCRNRGLSTISGCSFFAWDKRTLD